jgi:cellulose synthase/poly-beta-1,6-N-acetylglucosamine synthase-like glycosyltransferase
MAEAYVVLSLLAILGTLLTLPGTLELLIVTIGNLLPFHPKTPPPFKKSRLAVIVPAHNEEQDIKRTLDSLNTCTGEFDLIVIADNCTDATADIARACQARVLERQDVHNRGKNFALIYAFEQLRPENYTAYITIDADTIVQPNLIEEVRTSLDSGAEAVQVTDLVKDVNHQTMKSRLLYLASVAFNYVRPNGRQKLGLSTGINGNGFTFTKELIDKIPIPKDTIVEDVSYHLKMVAAGSAVTYNDRTHIYALPPQTAEAFEQQRTRWEGGRMRLLIQEVPFLLKEIFKGNWRLIEPLLDLLLLPLSYHTLILLLVLLIPFCPTQLYALFGLFLVLVHVAIAFIYGKCGWEDFKAIIMVPPYLLWKLKFLRKLSKAVSNGISWIRTGRK